MITKFLNEHQTIASVLTIIVSMIVITSWLTSDIKTDLRDMRHEMRETNKRIDALFHFVLTKEKL